MESYRIKSIIGEIADGIEALIERKVIRQDSDIILYGLERHSFAMRTILANLGYHNIEGYISNNEALVAQYQFDIKNFACRFLNREEDAINVWGVEERLQPFDDGALVLVASEKYAEAKSRLEALGYEENRHFYIVYDFEEKELEALFAGMKKMSLPEIHQTEKEILAYVDGQCRKHGLRYWVCGGTLLGTIRHKGFIPWDDDIDIFLPWRDYQKLIEVFEETENYSMLGFGTSEVNEFPDPFAKVVDKRTLIDENIGTVRKVNPLSIDVFPLVGMPDGGEERKLFFAGYKELNRSIWQAFYASNGKTDVFPVWYEKQKAYLSRYDFDQSDYVGVLGTAYWEKDCTTRQVYEKTLRMPFEDMEVNVAAGYKEYLDHLYGSDWMQIPEESKRKTHHTVNAYRGS